mmetsp:Transcript_7560/g.7654  ORF Transcript_7560/g.7654 Transcript_7560/m.7654 type:complete len:182 (-) Transcript_7560:1811-2356(-)
MTAPLFGLVIPGRSPVFDFQIVNETKATTLVEQPQSITEITFFLLPSSPIPVGYGAILYYAIHPFTSWEVLGSVTLQKPSGIFRTGWSTKEDVVGCPMVQLGVALEPLETIENLNLMASGVDDRFSFAHKIANNLFQYMISFSQGSQAGMMVVPNNIFDEWMKRFDRKYKLDPNFMMKEEI